MSTPSTSTLRQRRRSKQDESSITPDQNVDHNQGSISQNAYTITKTVASRSELWTLLTALVGGILITCGVLSFLNYRVQQVDNGRSLPDVSRAMQHIQIMAKERRFVGTKALEDCLQYVEREIVKMRPLAESNGMRLDVHTFRSGPGSFSTSIGTRYLINSYDDLPSVVARLRPSDLGEDTDAKALLINAHVDSAIGSFGASDNIVGAAATMELIRSLAGMEKSVNALKRPVIFLFNGAEEAVLMAAHSFVEQHPWAPTVQAHINIESLGSGDSYLLFRLGPNNPWLAEAYARAASVPLASVTANDIFSSRMIPAETDYRVFDEFGGIPGYDFVILDNGYIYHTDYDDRHNIDVNSVKHGSALFQELTLELAGNNDAIGTFLDGNERKTGLQKLVSAAQESLGFFKTEKSQADLKVTFFDILHTFTITYDESDARVINSLVLFATAAIWTVKIACMGSRSLLRCIWMVFTLLATLPASLASGSFAALVYSKGLNANLTWYGSWEKAFFLYAIPTFFGTLSVLLLMLPQRLSAQRYDEMLFALTLLYGFIAFLFTKLNIMSSYIPIILILAADVCAIEGSAVHPILRHSQLMLVNGIIGAKQLKYSLTSTLPLLGRIRSIKVPHEVIASMIVGVLALIHFIWAALPLLSHYASSLRRLRYLTFAVCLGTALWVIKSSGNLSNSHGTQYSKRAPKRISAHHFYSPQLQPESVLCLASWDPIRLNVDKIMHQVQGSVLNQEISPIPLWGSMGSTPFESFRIFQGFLQEVHVFETTVRPDFGLPGVTVTSEEKVDSGWNITVSIEAPDSHGISLRMMVGEDTPVKSWSLAAKLEKSEDGSWIHHAGSPYVTFWMVVDESSNGSAQRAKVPASVACSRLGTSRSPSVLKMLTFEGWEAAVTTVSTGIEVEL